MLSHNYTQLILRGLRSVHIFVPQKWLDQGSQSAPILGPAYDLHFWAYALMGTHAGELPGEALSTILLHILQS